MTQPALGDYLSEWHTPRVRHGGMSLPALPAGEHSDQRQYALSGLVPAPHIAPLSTYILVLRS